jgi:acyl transferase domain-containing protein
MNPQQRKLLSVVHESFENAEASLEELSSSKTACFVGCFTSRQPSGIIWNAFSTRWSNQAKPSLFIHKARATLLFA